MNMLRNILLFVLLLAPAAAFAQGTAQRIQGTNGGYPVAITGTVAPTGTQDVNIVQTGGVTQLRGAGAVGTGSERIAVGQDVTTIAGSAPGTAAAPSANVLSAVPVASAASVAGVAPVFSASVETGHVIKASAGNLYSLSATANSTLSAAAWAIMVFNSTTVPAAGAVTPVWCMLLPAGSTGYSGAFPTPLYLSTGISIAVSVGQTCFTKVDSANGFISANAQ